MTTTMLLRVLAAIAGGVGLLLAVRSFVQDSAPDLATSMVVLAAAALLLYRGRRASDKAENER